MDVVINLILKNIACYYRDDHDCLDGKNNQHLSLTLCIPRGWYLFLTKMSTRYKNACQAFSLQQNPMKAYILRERMKYTFTSIIEIMGYIKIVMS